MELTQIVASTGHWTAESDAGIEVGHGSCWPVGASQVVTNLHVAAAGPRARVEFEGLIPIAVSGLVAVDQPRDLVIAQLRAQHGRQPLPLAGDLPKVGEEVYVVGSPLGLRRSLTRGIVSGIRGADDLKPFGLVARSSDRFVQIDAAISQGSSGGPIVGATGEVLAVSTFLLAHGQALNFGSPAPYVAELIDCLGACKPLADFVTLTSDSLDSASAIDAAGEVANASILIEECIARLFALVMLADGVISEEEKEVLIDIVDFWGLDPSRFEASLIDYTRRSMAPLPYNGATEAVLYLDAVLHVDQKETLLRGLIAMAAADGLDANELSALDAIGEAWGLGAV